MREREIDKYFTTELKKIGAVVRKLQWVGQNGAPDKLFALYGKVHLVELKQEKGRISWGQALEHRRFKKVGVNISVLSSIEEVDIFIRKIQMRKGQG